MSQGSLFFASQYILKAYDQLVLAYAEHELEEIEMLKSAVMRAHIGTREQYEQTKLPLPSIESVDAEEAPF